MKVEVAILGFPVLAGNSPHGRCGPEATVIELTQTGTPAGWLSVALRPQTGAQDGHLDFHTAPEL